MENVEPIERDYAQHPYLKRMQFRGGGYAILTALKLRSRDGSKRQFMYKSLGKKTTVRVSFIVKGDEQLVARNGKTKPYLMLDTPVLQYINTY